MARGIFCPNLVHPSLPLVVWSFCLPLSSAFYLSVVFLPNFDSVYLFLIACLLFWGRGGGVEGKACGGGGRWSSKIVHVCRL